MGDFAALVKRAERRAALVRAENASSGVVDETRPEIPVADVPKLAIEINPNLDGTIDLIARDRAGREYYRTASIGNNGVVTFPTHNLTIRNIDRQDRETNRLADVAEFDIDGRGSIAGDPVEIRIIPFPDGRFSIETTAGDGTVAPGRTVTFPGMPGFYLINASPELEGSNAQDREIQQFPFSIGALADGRLSIAAGEPENITELQPGESGSTVLPFGGRLTLINISNITPGPIVPIRDARLKAGDRPFPDNMREILDAAELVYSAWANPGPRPDMHLRAIDNLKENWPTLYAAVTALFRQVRLDRSTRRPEPETGSSTTPGEAAGQAIGYEIGQWIDKELGEIETFPVDVCPVCFETKVLSATYSTGSDQGVIRVCSDDCALTLNSQDREPAIAPETPAEYIGQVPAVDDLADRIAEKTKEIEPTVDQVRTEYRDGSAFSFDWAKSHFAEPVGPDSFGGSDYPETGILDAARYAAESRELTDDEKADLVFNVRYWPAEDRPPAARNCDNCKRWFTGPAKLDARNTFCGEPCKDAFYEFGRNNPETAVVLAAVPNVAQAAANGQETDNKRLSAILSQCDYCSNQLPPIEQVPGRITVEIPGDDPAILCGVECTIKFVDMPRDQRTANNG
jgi:hypothetical protein